MSHFKLTEEAIMGIVKAAWEISDEDLQEGCCIEITKLWATEATVKIGVFSGIEMVEFCIINDCLSMQFYDADYHSLINLSEAIRVFEEFKQKEGQQ